jgi:hypothetical protein
MVSEKKWAPAATRRNDTKPPTPSAAKSTARLLLNAKANAREKKPAAPSPDENEQLVSHWSLMKKAGVNCFDPPNSAISLGLARPKLSLKITFTTKPAPRIRTRNR